MGYILANCGRKAAACGNGGRRAHTFRHSPGGTETVRSPEASISAVDIIEIDREGLFALEATHTHEFLEFDAAAQVAISQLDAFHFIDRDSDRHPPQYARDVGEGKSGGSARCHASDHP